MPRVVIRTRNPTKRADADLRLRPRGQWDRPFWIKSWNISVNCVILRDNVPLLPHSSRRMRLLKGCGRRWLLVLGDRIASALCVCVCVCVREREREREHCRWRSDDMHILDSESARRWETYSNKSRALGGGRWYLQRALSGLFQRPWLQPRIYHTYDVPVQDSRRNSLS